MEILMINVAANSMAPRKRRVARRRCPSSSKGKTEPECEAKTKKIFSGKEKKQELGSTFFFPLLVRCLHSAPLVKCPVEQTADRSS